MASIQSEISGFSFPEWLEPLRVHDELMSQGYESVKDEFRVALKAGLAFNHYFFGERDCFEQQSRSSRLKGFFSRVYSKPAPWALIFFPEGYSSAPRLAAAFMAARLAGVKNLMAACLGGAPTPQACAAIELAGIEDIFVLDHAQASLLATDLRLKDSDGGIVLLDAEKLADLRALSLDSAVPCFAESRKPRIRIQKKSGHNLDIIAWGQPDAVIISDEQIFPDAFYCGEQIDETAGQGRLLLLPGMECCWIHNGLSPDFFRRRSIWAGRSRPQIF